jgi:4-carboxymuconolactone decarboxylase
MPRRTTTAIALAAAMAACPVLAGDRFPVLKSSELSPEQMKIVQSLLASPRGGGAEVTPEAMDKMIARGPFNAYLRSPALGEQLVKLGEQIRYHTSLPLRLNEFAILITARQWNSGYEWYAHHPLAIKAGLDPKIATDLAKNRRPKNMKEEEAAVYDFCTQLHRNHKVGDAAYKRAAGLFGEKGVMDLIGVSGFYTLVSMTLNTAEVGVPAGAKDPLK